MGPAVVRPRVVVGGGGGQGGGQHLAVRGGQPGQFLQDRRQQLPQTGPGVAMVRGPALRGQHERAVGAGQLPGVPQQGRTPDTLLPEQQQRLRAAGRAPHALENALDLAVPAQRTGRRRTAG